MLRITRVTASLAALLALGACQSRSAATPEPAPITNQPWTLKSLEGQALDSAQLEKPLTLALTTAGTRVNGYAGCNRFAGTYTLGPGTLEFGPLVMTRMACPSMELENRYVKALAAVRQYRLEKDELVLEADGTELARFVAALGKTP